MCFKMELKNTSMHLYLNKKRFGVNCGGEILVVSKDRCYKNLSLAALVTIMHMDINSVFTDLHLGIHMIKKKSQACSNSQL